MKMARSKKKKEIIQQKTKAQEEAKARTKKKSSTTRADKTELRRIVQAVRSAKAVAKSAA